MKIITITLLLVAAFTFTGCETLLVEQRRTVVRDGYYDNGYRNDRYRDDRYRNDRYRDNRYRDDRYRDNRYRDDRYRDTRYRDDRYERPTRNYYDRGYRRPTTIVTRPVVIVKTDDNYRSSNRRNVKFREDINRDSRNDDRKDKKKKSKKDRDDEDEENRKDR